MAIKYTLLGMLIYAAMGCYLLAFALALPKRRPMTGAAKGLFALGCLVALTGVVLRTAEVMHPPLQNMFEVCLFLGAMVFPLSMFCRRFLGSPNLAADAMIGWVILFPAGFVFSAEPQQLPPALQSWLFIPHVSSYLLAYVILFMAAVPATVLLFRGQPTPSEEALRSPGQRPDQPRPDLERAVYNLVCLGFPLLTLGLVLGAVWGKYAWGDYWNWDPKELWSLATFLIYVLYLHVRYMQGPRRARLHAALVLAGTAGVVITLLWVNLGRIFHGMHSYAS